MTIRYTIPRAVDEAWRQQMAQLELHVLRAKIGVTAAQAALGQAEAALEAVETDYRAWLEQPPPQAEG
jgi:hypothetical protein